MNKQPETGMRRDYREGDEHEPFHSLLPAFAMICLEGNTGGSEWNNLETHLDSCTSCRAELDELLQLLDDTYTGVLETEIESPMPDLAYLPPWSTPERPHDLVAVVHTVRAAMRQVFIQFTEMLTIAMRQPEPAGAFRSGDLATENEPGESDRGPAEEYTYQLQGSTPDDIDIAVDFTLENTAQQLYRVKVTVIDQEQDPFSQDGHRVMMHYEARTIELITDASGCVSFHGIPYVALAEIQITINLR